MNKIMKVLSGMVAAITGLFATTASALDLTAVEAEFTEGQGNLEQIGQLLIGLAVVSAIIGWVVARLI